MPSELFSESRKALTHALFTCRADDMLAIMFPHLYDDFAEEFEEHDMDAEADRTIQLDSDDEMEGMFGTGLSGLASRTLNAVAGPSRLH